jgi:acyl carrier protein
MENKLNSKELEEEISKLFKEVMGENVQVDINTKRSDVAEWDSINHLNLIVELESRYNLSLSMEEIENLKTVKQVIRLIMDRQT